MNFYDTFGFEHEELRLIENSGEYVNFTFTSISSNDKMTSR